MSLNNYTNFVVEHTVVRFMNIL